MKNAKQIVTDYYNWSVKENHSMICGTYSNFVKIDEDYVYTYNTVSTYNSVRKFTFEQFCKSFRLCIPQVFYN